MEDVISAEEEAEIAAAWVQALGSEYPEDRQEAVQVLVQWVCEAFGDEGEGFVRWCYACDVARLDEGVRRLRAFLAG